MVNQKLADIFGEIADFLELKGENPFKIKAYQKAARTLKGFSVSAADMTDAELLAVPGVGKAVAEKIREYVTTGDMKAHRELRDEFPPQILELLELPGLGAKKASALYRELRIGSVSELLAALDAGLIASMPGFGAKSEANLRVAITKLQNRDTRLHLGQAAEIVEFFREHLAGVERFEAAGSFRRRRETVGDIDLLVAAPSSREIMAKFCSFAGADELLLSGETKSSLRYQGRIQVDLRVVPRESWGAALQYFTGSKDHNVALRLRAEKMGLKLNEYGLFPHGKPSLSCVEEEDVYGHLDLPWIPPELRETGQEIGQDVPVLVQESDIQGNLHTHSTWSDGTEELEVLAQRAIHKGYKYLAITDHSRSSFVANGLSIERLLEQRRFIAELNDGLQGKLRLLWGSECDILSDGSLDYPDDILEQLDFVVAAVHSDMGADRDKMTRRLVRAVSHPKVRVLAHPTGRLLGRRDPYDADWELVYRTAIEHNTALEINGNPRRQDLSDVMVRRAAGLGARISLATDAHGPNDFEHNMGWAVSVARRAGLAPGQILNAQGLDALLG